MKDDEQPASTVSPETTSDATDKTRKALESGSGEEVVQFIVKMGPFTCRPLKSGWLAVGVDGQEKLGMPVEVGQVVTLEVREGR